MNSYDILLSFVYFKKSTNISHVMLFSLEMLRHLQAGRAFLGHPGNITSVITKTPTGCLIIKEKNISETWADHTNGDKHNVFSSIKAFKTYNHEEIAWSKISMKTFQRQV